MSDSIETPSPCRPRAYQTIPPPPHPTCIRFQSHASRRRYAPREHNEHVDGPRCNQFTIRHDQKKPWFRLGTSRLKACLPSDVNVSVLDGIVQVPGSVPFLEPCLMLLIVLCTEYTGANSSQYDPDLQLQGWGIVKHYSIRWQVAKMNLPKMMTTY